MKKIAAMMLVGILALSMGACAKPDTQEKTRVKCPACGYEFDVPGRGR